MAERRYTEQEVADIFQRATETQAPEYRRLPSVEGLTLAELQEIGRQVAIAPELVARAALALDRAERAPVRRFLGFPVRVSRTVELGRELSDAEWERLVVDLRETFDARGQVRQEGTMRHWANGNLHAYLEPGESGQRLRLRTFNENARSLMIAGLATIGMTALIAAVLEVAGGVAAARVPRIAVVAAIGLGMFAWGAVRLPSWARRRLQQMDAVADRVLATPPSGPDQPGG